MAMVHLGDPLYYQQLQEMTADHDRVLYELIVDKDLIREDSTGHRRLKEPMMPAFDQLQRAARHGLQAQLEALDYMKEKWVLADMERSAIRRLQAQRGEGPSGEEEHELRRAVAGAGAVHPEMPEEVTATRIARVPFLHLDCRLWCQLQLLRLPFKPDFV